MYQLIKAFEIRTSILFNISFPNHNILSCFLFFFFIIDFLIPEVIAQIFIPTAELVTSTGTQNNDANGEIEIQLVFVEAKISKCSSFHSLNYVLFLQ